MKVRDALTVVLMMIISASILAQNKALTNYDLIKMAKAGLTEHVLIAAIHGAENARFDTSPRGLKELRSAKLSEAVIKTLLLKETRSAASPVSVVLTAPIPIQLSQAPQNTKFQWANVAVNCISSFIGAAFAFGFALWLARRQRIDNSTSSMINEFSSRDMLQSRYVTHSLARQIAIGKIALRDVALSSVQDCPEGFVGSNVNGLTEHQHMSNLIGWVRRLSVQLTYRWVNREIIARAIGGSLQWSLPFLLQLASEAEAVMKDHPSPRSPSARAAWIYAVRHLDAQLKKAQYEKRPPGPVPRISPEPLLAKDDQESGKEAE